MVLLDDDELADRCLLLRRWGRRSEVQLFGSKKGDKRFFSQIDRRPRVRQPLHLRRGRAGTSSRREISRRVRARAAATSCRENLARRQRNFDRCSASTSRTCPDVFVLPRTLDGARDRLAHVPGHHPARVGHPPRRAPAAHGGATASTRAWCGRATSLRQPAFKDDPAPRRRPAGCPNADRVMEQGLVLPVEPRPRRRRRRLHLATRPTAFLARGRHLTGAGGRPATSSSRPTATPVPATTMYRGVPRPRVPRRVRRVAQPLHEPVPATCTATCARATGTTSGASASRRPTASSPRWSSRTRCRRSSRPAR